MVNPVFEVTACQQYADWVKEDGRGAPVRELTLRDVSDQPEVEEVQCMVYGVDALKRYELGERVFAALRIFVSINEDENYVQEIRAVKIKKFDMPKNS